MFVIPMHIPDTFHVRDFGSAMRANASRQIIPSCVGRAGGYLPPIDK